MDFSVCAQCGVEIENKGIHFRNRVFCCDECCEEFEAVFAEKGEPVIDELLDDGMEPDELDDDALEFSEDDMAESLDDDYEIKLEDF